MATFLLIHGAGDTGWYWHLAEARLRAAGHLTSAPDLPCDRSTATLDDYLSAATEAVTGQRELVIVGQSYGAFTATLAADRLPGTRLLVLVAGMVPAPGERPSQWWDNTGFQAAPAQANKASAEAGPIDSFYNGVPRPLAEEALRRGGRGESSVVWNTEWPLAGWPDVPTRFIVCRDDRIFPAAFLRRVVSERLDIAPDEVPGGHCVALSNPDELADRLVSYFGD